jgi:hypothetical protein
VKLKIVAGSAAEPKERRDHEERKHKREPGGQKPQGEAPLSLRSSEWWRASHRVFIEL